ncbi:MAG: retroviral-like aspartic protease family protein [Bacteroidales bacterium]|nr:retroviral-like aspartic protease family protein [Bacteroidales bacterium]
MKITTKHLRFCTIFLLIFGFVSCGTRTESVESYFDDDISETEYFDDEISEDYVEIPYREIGGVKQIPVKINGMGFYMIFDTGCSTNLISKLELLSLIKNGVISEEDFLGVTQSSIADGSVVENLVVNLKEVVLDDKIIFYNVQASVSENIEAPLLLGNEILNQVESYEIDNNEEVIKFILR